MPAVRSPLSQTSQTSPALRPVTGCRDGARASHKSASAGAVWVLWRGSLLNPRSDVSSYSGGASNSERSEVPRAQRPGIRRMCRRRQRAIPGLRPAPSGPLWLWSYRGSTFEDLGGDSLRAVELLAQVEERTGHRIPLETLSLTGGSIRGLASWIDQQSAGETPVLLRAGPGSETQTLVLAHVQGGHLSDYLPVLDDLAPRRAVVGIHPRGLRAGGFPDNSMAALAAH